MKLINSFFNPNQESHMENARMGQARGFQYLLRCVHCFAIYILTANNCTRGWLHPRMWLAFQQEWNATLKLSSDYRCAALLAHSWSYHCRHKKRNFKDAANAKAHLSEFPLGMQILQQLLTPKETFSTCLSLLLLFSHIWIRISYCGKYIPTVWYTPVKSKLGKKN